MPTSVPSLSIIVPNHNKASYIRETLDSLVKQRYPEWEAIVVDDGSTDGSDSIAEAYSQLDKRFRLIRLPKQNHGGSVARNVGLKNARADYVMFLDSDDLLDEGCLDQRVQVMQADPTLDFAVFAMRSFVSGDLRKKAADWLPVKENALEKFLAHQLPWSIVQPLYRKSFLRDGAFLFPENTSRLQDVFFHTEILLSKPHFSVHPHMADCSYRVDSGRHPVDAQTFYQNWANAVVQYHGAFIKRLDYLHIKYLNLTLLEGLTSLNTARLGKKISGAVQQRISYLIIQESSNAKVRWALRCYARISGAIPFHLPGLRFLFRKAVFRLG